MRTLILFSLFLASLHLQSQVTFTNMSELLQPVSGSYGNLASDMNGDNLDDIVRVTSEGIYIDYQQVDGTFLGAYFAMSIQNLPSWSICAADIDDNGYNDLCLGAGNAVSFVYASDDGSSYTEVAHPEYIFTQRTTFADIDNDGNLDAFANHDVDQCHPYRNVNGELVLDFSLISTLDAGGNYAAIWVDYDNDWDQDLYITSAEEGLPGEMHSASISSIKIMVTVLLPRRVRKPISMTETRVGLPVLRTSTMMVILMHSS